MKRILCMVGLLALLSACEKQGEEAAATGATNAAAPAEQVVMTDIPSDLQAEAKREVTAENVDSVAAELEKEIEADTP